MRRGSHDRSLVIVATVKCAEKQAHRNHSHDSFTPNIRVSSISFAEDLSPNEAEESQVADDRAQTHEGGTLDLITVIPPRIHFNNRVSDGLTQRYGAARLAKGIKPDANAEEA